MGGVRVDRVAGHEDSFGLFDDRAALLEITGVLTVLNWVHTLEEVPRA